MRALPIGLLILFISQGVAGKDLEEGKAYRLEKSVYNLIRTRDKQANFVALKKLKIYRHR